MRDVAIVFARAPRLGTVKRRLARDIGDVAALRFHRAMLRQLLRRLGRDRRWRTILSITPDRARIAWRGPVTGQGRGNLGERMARALGQARNAVLVGCDIPGLGPADVAAAFRVLRRADAVFGPAEDGGYWLVGLGRRRPERPFANVRWSGPHALADTLVNFRHRRVAFLRHLQDVDTVEDLRALGPPERARSALAPRRGPASC
jgi:rSAM/selenodomain-associated transferase 1